MKKTLILLACLSTLVACNTGNNTDDFRIYNPAKEILIEAGINTDGLSEFYLFSYSDVNTKNGNLYWHNVSCSDGNKSHIFLINREEIYGRPTSNYNLIKELICDRPAAYSSIDVGYGEKEYKIFDTTIPTNINYLESTLFCVLLDYFHVSKEQPKPQKGEYNELPNMNRIIENIRLVIDCKEKGTVYINSTQKDYLYRPMGNGVFWNNSFYGLDGNKKYEVSENTHWGKCDYYYDENGYKAYTINPDLSGFWLLNYKDSQFLGAEMGLWYNPTKATFTDAYGPFVIKICIEDLKEGAYCWRSINITSLEDNNRYESLDYAGCSGNVYKWLLSGTAYSGDKFTYTISVDAEKQTIVVTDQKGQTVPINNEFTCGYTKHR